MDYTHVLNGGPKGVRSPIDGICRMGSYTDLHKTAARELRNGQLIVAPSVTEGSVAGMPASYTANLECQGCYTGQHTNCSAREE
jgi:hypothetical protein